MSKETKFFGTLALSHPDLLLIKKAITEKYGLSPVYPGDLPIIEIFLGDEVISLDEFRQDIRNHVLEKLDNIFPEDFVKQYRATKRATQIDSQQDLSVIPEVLRLVLQGFFEQVIGSAKNIYPILDAQIDSITNMLYRELLMGQDTEAPEEWFGKVSAMNTGGETIIFAMANELTNLDLLFQQIRELHRKTFGIRSNKVTKGAVGSAYFLKLNYEGKDKDFILDEFIRLNKFNMPSRTNTARYVEERNRYAQRLKKILQRSKKILDVIIRDKK